MSTHIKKIVALLAFASAGSLIAQTPAPAPATKPSTDEAVVLTPFEVSTDRDTGYQATETLAGTRIRTQLGDVGSAIQVITKDFLNDVGATDNTTLLQYTTNSEVGGVHSTYGGLGNGTTVDESTALRNPSANNRVRGLAAADNARDFFISDIPWDSYNVDRIDIQRGANAMLFGLGSPAGIINATTHSAEFRDFGSVDARFDSYSSERLSLDLNQVLIPKVLAIRLDGLWDATKYEQKPAYQNNKRIYGTVRFDPQIFKDPAFHTSIKAKYEDGNVRANRPRTVTPNDALTPWFRPVDATSMLGGMGKTSVNNGYDSFRSDVANIVPGDGRGLEQSATVNYQPWLSGAGTNQQQPLYFIDGTTDQLYKVYGGYINPGARTTDGSLLGAASGLTSKRFATEFFGLNNLPAYAVNAKLPGQQYGQYKNMSLLDPTVFDFYHNLIDGPNKMEYQKWNAYNIDVTQTFWNDRLGIDLSYDRQKYQQGSDALLGGSPTITIDILKNFPDYYLSGANGTTSVTNPNYGRPYISASGNGGRSDVSDRTYDRASVFGEVRASDFTKNEFLLKLFGKHRFNGVYSNEKYQTETRTWRDYAASKAWDAYWNGNDANSSSIGDRPPIPYIYLGSAINGQATASGAYIPRITTNVQLPDASAYTFNSTWTNFGTAFNAPWTVPATLANVYDNTNPLFQNSNPANYVGWNNNTQLNLLRYNNGADSSLITGAQKSLRVTKSYAGTYQGFFWNDAIIPTLGWRYDEVESKGVSALANGSNRGILNLQPDVYRLPDVFPANQIFKDHSASGGAVVHLNRLLERDPLPINISVGYNASSNFQVTDLRRDVYGNPLGNPTGKTKDYSLTLSTKDSKYSLKVTKYQSSVAGANTQLSVGGIGSTITQGLKWRNVFLYQLGVYTMDTANQPLDRNNWQPAPGQTQADADAQRDASIKAWNAIQAKLTPTGFFSAWGFTPGPTNPAALTDRTTYAANPAAFQPDPATVFAYTPLANGPQGFAVTADTKSEGYEYEFTANPTRDWRVTFNAGETTAVRNNVGGPVLDDLVNYMDAQMAGPAGQMRQFSGGSGAATVLGNWNSWRGNYALLKLGAGSAAPELRKWRYNVVTNYTFRNGALKNVGIGGGYRWQDKVVIGYPVLATDPTKPNFDLSKPYYGPAEKAVDLWASYTHKVTEKVEWKIQLNVRNVGAKDGLIPISVEPDGHTWASVRTKPPQDWTLTNTFSF